MALALIDIGSGNLHSVENALRADFAEDLLCQKEVGARPARPNPKLQLGSDLSITTSPNGRSVRSRSNTNSTAKGISGRHLFSFGLTPAARIYQDELKRRLLSNQMADFTDLPRQPWGDRSIRMTVIEPLDPADDTLLDLLDYEPSDNTEVYSDACSNSASSHHDYYGPGAVVFHVSQNEPPLPNETDLEREA